MAGPHHLPMAKCHHKQGAAGEVLQEDRCLRPKTQEPIFRTIIRVTMVTLDQEDTVKETVE